MDLSNLSTEMILIGVSAIIIISFFFGELSRKTNVPSVLMLIIFGVIFAIIGGAVSIADAFFPQLLK